MGLAAVLAALVSLAVAGGAQQDPRNARNGVLIGVDGFGYHDQPQVGRGGRYFFCALSAGCAVEQGKGDAFFGEHAAGC